MVFSFLVLSSIILHYNSVASPTIPNMLISNNRFEFAGI